MCLGLDLIRRAINFLTFLAFQLSLFRGDKNRRSQSTINTMSDGQFNIVPRQGLGSPVIPVKFRTGSDILGSGGISESEPVSPLVLVALT